VFKEPFDENTPESEKQSPINTNGSGQNGNPLPHDKLQLEKLFRESKEKDSFIPCEKKEKLTIFLAEQEQERESEKASRSLLASGRAIAIGIGIGIVITLLGTRFLPFGQPKNPSTTAVSPVANVQTPAQSVTATAVETTSVNRTLKATGTVAAFEMTPVASGATGLQIKQILVDEGDFVRAGQLLVQLDDSVLQAQLTQAKAAVAETQANLSQLRAGNRSEEIERAREQVVMAQAQLKQAKSDLELAQKRAERNQNLEAAGAIARDRLDEIINEERNKQAAYNTANAQLREAQQQLKEKETGARQEEIAQAAAKLAQAKAEMQVVMAQLKDTRIIAPVSGKIAQRNARVGDITSTSEKLFNIIENGRLELRVKVPETQLPSIRLGQSVKITSDADSRLKLVGKVREINPVVNEESRQATLEIELPKSDSLKPGMFLRASITTATANSLTVPMGSVLPQADGTSLVYVIGGDETVKAQQIQTGELFSDKRVEIVSGLKEGDRVVVKGAAYLKDGDKVSVVQ
jgi:multidrug efflux pump subunit AcrA (membrane-fusion protein)